MDRGFSLSGMTLPRNSLRKNEAAPTGLSMVMTWTIS